ncbi:MAG: NYN domain-containing protein [Nanoarchaeota archaeon]
MNSEKEKIVIYIDGSNFYFSIKDTFNCRIDLEKFCKKLARDYELVKINYYIAPVDQLENPKAYAQQQSFFEKLRKINKLNLILGRLEKRKKDGKIYHVEKATDVNLALDLTLDAQKGEYDKAFIISNDGDFSGAVSAAIGFRRKVVYVVICTNKSISYHLKKVASSTFRIKKEFIDECKLGE